MRFLAIVLCVLMVVPPVNAGRVFNGSTDVITISKSIITAADIDDTLTGWKPVCIKPACDPGGSGTPTATAQTINNAVPSLDGGSMQVSITGPAFSNALWVYLTGSRDNAITLSFDIHVFPSANSNLLGSLEYDQFIFDKTHNVEFMFGTQCNQVNNLWQIWDQLNGNWVNTAVACSLSSSTWHEIRQTVHRVPGDTGACSGQPCMYYDTLIVDGVSHTLNLVEPAGPLPGTFASQTGFQFQLDIGSAGSPGVPVTENMDEATFIVNASAVDVVTTVMTMAIWFKPETIPGTEVDMISKWGAGGNQYLMQFSQTTPGQISVAYGHPGISNYGCGTTISTPGVWHHAASTWDQAGGFTAIFLDGVQCAFIAASAPLTPSNNNLFIGARDAGLTQAFRGVLAEAGIWNAALTNAEILSLAKGVPPNKVRRASLVGYFPLYGAKSPEPDLSLNVQNGTLTGTTTGVHCPCSVP